MKKKPLNAVSVRSLLTAVFVILILAVVGGFTYGLQQVRTYALDVTHTVADANASGKQVEELERLKQQLVERQSLVIKADSLFSNEAAYQAQALADIQTYASRYGLTVSGTSFDIDPAILAPATAAAGGKPFTVALRVPSSYSQLLQFLNAVEGNIPKIQIENINLSRPASGNVDEIETGEILMTIATR